MNSSFRKWVVDTTDEVRMSFGLLVLRLFSGTFMLTHGYPKLLRLISGDEIKFMNFLGLGAPLSLGLAVFAEFVCAILIVFGLATRLASVPLMVAMSTAAFVAHGDDPFGTKEKPLLFLVIFVVLFISGGGKFSMDRKLSG